MIEFYRVGSGALVGTLDPDTMEASNAAVASVVAAKRGMGWDDERILAWAAGWSNGYDAARRSSLVRLPGELGQVESMHWAVVREAFGSGTYFLALPEDDLARGLTIVESLQDHTTWGELRAGSSPGDVRLVVASLGLDPDAPPDEGGPPVDSEVLPTDFEYPPPWGDVSSTMWYRWPRQVPVEEAWVVSTVLDGPVLRIPGGDSDRALQLLSAHGAATEWNGDVSRLMPDPDGWYAVPVVEGTRDGGEKR